jgi:hypothetical protein
VNRREQMTEHVASLIAARQPFEDTARSVLDALMPQVTTDAEVWALPVDSLLVSDRGVAFRIGFGTRGDKALYGMEGWRAIVQNPLTVVWTPEGSRRSGGLR